MLGFHSRPEDSNQCRLTRVAFDRLGEDCPLDPRGTKILTSPVQGKKYGEERIKANINMTALKHEVYFPLLFPDFSSDKRTRRILMIVQMHLSH